jgi:diacylglycerol kinase (ATP)
MSQNNNFITGRLKGGIIALKGAYKVLSTEHSVMVQFSLFILLSILGYITNISKTEWMFHIMAWGMVLSVEALNTAVEKLCDFVHEHHHHKIGFIKDISAGAVAFTALAALAVELIIFIPKFI